MDLKDATLMILSESAAHPGLAMLAQLAYDQLNADGQVDYHLLSDMVEEASGTGVLRAIRQKFGQTGHDAIFGPILREIDWQKPVQSSRTASAGQDSPDPLTAASW
ncbi:MAG: hypothetical protein ACRDOI_06035 [Trebonia sp.]